MRVQALTAVVLLSLVALSAASSLPAYFEYTQTSVPDINLKSTPKEIEAGAAAAGSIMFSVVLMLLFLQFSSTKA